jgi:sister chromatid cohesion protein PDS5
MEFNKISFLQNDSIPQVRELFAKKLHKGLYKGIPRCLPLDFMGFYAICGRETDRRYGFDLLLTEE